ncbi:MAG: ABC transporter ATP-binding protein [Sphingobium sp.]
MELLRFDDVSLVLEGLRLLDDITLAIEVGERVAIIGDSGSGKSWILRLAMGLAEPTSGTIRLMDEPLDSLTGEERRLLRARCGLVMQGGSLLGELSVEDNLRLALDPTAAGTARASRRIDRLLLEFGLEQNAMTRAGALSVGERRRAELARAFARDPDLLILDEPFEGAFARSDGLEAQVRRRIVPHGRALLLLTQDAALAERLCERTYRLDRGRLVQQSAAVTEPVAIS